MFVVTKRLDGMEVNLGPCDIALDGDPAPPKKGNLNRFFYSFYIILIAKKFYMRL